VLDEPSPPLPIYVGGVVGRRRAPKAYHPHVGQCTPHQNDLSVEIQSNTELHNVEIVHSDATPSPTSAQVVSEAVHSPKSYIPPTGTGTSISPLPEVAHVSTQKSSEQLDDYGFDRVLDSMIATPKKPSPYDASITSANAPIPSIDMTDTPTKTVPGYTGYKNFTAYYDDAWALKN
jgi:hypothetical protein